MLHTFTGLLVSTSSSFRTPTISGAQIASVMSSSTSQRPSESCDITTVYKTLSVTTVPTAAINPSQISHSKQGKVNNVAVTCKELRMSHVLVFSMTHIHTTA